METLTGAVAVARDKLRQAVRPSNSGQVLILIEDRHDLDTVLADVTADVGDGPGCRTYVVFSRPVDDLAELERILQMAQDGRPIVLTHAAIVGGRRPVDIANSTPGLPNVVALPLA